MLVRSFIWLIALVAFALPPSFAPMTAMAAQSAMSDCPDHAPPPSPCPEKNAAKHAAGLCCPAMAGVVAVLPAVADAPSARFRFDHSVPVESHLTGLSLGKDPPPPRV